MLKEDWVARIEKVAETIKAELSGGNVWEAFRNLKGWYRDVRATTAWTCFLALERQTKDQEWLYQAAPPGGNKISINVDLYMVEDKPLGERELQECARALSNGRAAGTSFMRAEHIKEWL